METVAVVASPLPLRQGPRQLFGEAVAASSGIRLAAGPIDAGARAGITPSVAAAFQLRRAAVTPLAREVASEILVTAP